jgi:hypothetical protein
MFGKVTLDDGTVYAIAIDERDFRRWDLTFKGKGWPPGDQAGMLYQGFLAAAALFRQGEVPGATVDAILERIVRTDLDAEEAVRPTDGAPGPDSSSNSP